MQKNTLWNYLENKSVITVSHWIQLNLIINDEVLKQREKHTVQNHACVFSSHVCIGFPLHDIFLIVI